MHPLKKLTLENRSGKPVAMASVCSANEDVIIASLLLAKSLNKAILIEATSNQCNQFGGYTGMKPADFVALVTKLADQNNVPHELFHFGGDHLGPQVWRKQDAKVAMTNAEELMKCFVKAGFTKIHLDCSEGLGGEPAQVDDELSASRAIALAKVCEEHAPDPSKLVYVVGTEVPPPGGARADEVDQEIEPTPPERAIKTLEYHKAAFEAAGIADAWNKVIALVVQPGLEFAPMPVDHFDMSAPNNLSKALVDYSEICFEAHSTDYQKDAVFSELAKRNFSMLKVGPALTFAYRQAIYALDHIRAHLIPSQNGYAVYNVMEDAMLQDKTSWQGHYEGDEASLKLQRHFGYADRIRYYWPQENPQQALQKLEDDLQEKAAPLPLIEQYFDTKTLELADQLMQENTSWVKALIYAQIQLALKPYILKT